MRRNGIEVYGVEETVKAMKNVARRMGNKRARRKMLTPAARWLRQRTRKSSVVPKSRKDHRFKGAIVTSGNLRRSYRDFTQWKDSWDVFVGPRVDKTPLTSSTFTSNRKSDKKKFGGSVQRIGNTYSRARGWYAFALDQGADYSGGKHRGYGQKIIDRFKAPVRRRMAKGVRDAHYNLVKKNGISA